MIANELVDDIARLDIALKASKKRVEQPQSWRRERRSPRSSGSARSAQRSSSATPATSAGSRPKATSLTYNATAPVDVSSGPGPKHRLNQRGTETQPRDPHRRDRQLRFDTEGRADYERKLAEGKSSKDAIRSLKRRISDRVYRHLTSTPNAARPAETGGPGRTTRNDSELQRDRPHILNSRLFGSVTPGPENQRYDPRPRQARGSTPTCPEQPPKSPLDTKRLR